MIIVQHADDPSESRGQGERRYMLRLAMATDEPVFYPVADQSAPTVSQRINDSDGLKNDVVLTTPLEVEPHSQLHRVFSCVID